MSIKMELIVRKDLFFRLVLKYIQFYFKKELIMCHEANLLRVTLGVKKGFKKP